MLSMTAAQVCYPMTFIILVIPDDTLLHDHHPRSMRLASTVRKWLFHAAHSLVNRPL